MLLNNQLLTITSFPRAILHIDGDAFFASCEQARNPKLKNKPVITGKERGIAASLSYEAKARGVERGMPIFQIKKICPEAIILPSDYETYSLLSKRLYNIVRRYTSEVEEYGIDECFADITGLRRVFRMSYEKIAERIQQALRTELGFSFSIGLGPNKVIAKVGSKFKKPNGLTIIPGKKIHEYLINWPVSKVWGIGPATTALLQKFKIVTALEFAKQSEEWVKRYFSKPFYEIWQELNGRLVMPLNLAPKTSYAAIQKFKTFTPPSADYNFVFAELSKNIENACIKARRYNLATRQVIIILRTQNFAHMTKEIKLPRLTNFSHEIIGAAGKELLKIFELGQLYRASGVILGKLEEMKIEQLDLFNNFKNTAKLSTIYAALDKASAKFGKHTIFLGASFLAHKFSAHLGERGDKPERQITLFRGETARKRLGIPMFMGRVN